MVKAADAFAFNYDLATPPPVAEVGLNMFQKFMNDPSNIDGLLDEDPGGRRRRLQEVEQAQCRAASAGGHRPPAASLRLRRIEQPRFRR